MIQVLEKGRYIIPEGCIIDSFGREIIVRESRERQSRGKYNRCKYCKFFVKGKSIDCDSKASSNVCLQLPKKNGTTFYARTQYQIACEKFEKKETMEDEL